MMKTKSLLFVCLLVTSFNVFAQTLFPGYSTGNYTGVNAVFQNPANIADSRYKFHINLVGFGVGLQNTLQSYNIQTIKDFQNKNLSDIIGNSTEPISAIANIDVVGPSFMISLKQNATFAITTRVRAVANITDLDGHFINSITNTSAVALPYSFASDKNQVIVVNGWEEIGASFGREFLNTGKHFFKAGVTMKYLAGISNTYINLDNIKGSINKDANQNPFLQNSTGGVAIGEAGINFENFDPKDLFKFKNGGFGGDFGLVYEYRPDTSLYNNKAASKYKFKISASLLDVGKVSYDINPQYTAAYGINIGATQQFFLNQFDGKNFEEIKTTLDNNPNYFTKKPVSDQQVKVSLPTSLQLAVDYKITGGFYANLAAQLVLSKKNNVSNPAYTNTFTFTPRFENKWFGAYVPVIYNEMSGTKIGAALKLGPLFVGSGSIVSSLIDKSKQADVFFGIGFGGLYKN